MTSAVGTNWAGNYTYRAVELARPTSVAQLQELVAQSPRIRALGTRHTFSDITDSDGILVDLEGLPPDIRIDGASASVSLAAGVRYGHLAAALEAQGYAVANLASLPHISVAGAVATGTHGSGDRNVSLAGAVRALEVVGPDGTLRRLERADPEFDGSVVALGALGVVARLELDIEPTYLVQQEVRLGLPWSVIETRFDDITGAGYSVSMFTRFAGEDENQLWVKTRTGAPGTSDTFGTLAVDGPTHMLRGGSTEALTGQGGLPGPWLDRLPHFRMEFTPSRGEELQTEYYLPRDQAWRAIEALRRLEPTFGPLLQVAEIRTVAAESLWLSGAHDRDAVGVHFTWVRDEPAVRSALGPIEDALVPLGARPHWGKVFELDRSVVAGAFARYDDFVRLRDAVDPERKFGNAFLERYLP